jgi:hypothetical protein
MIRPTPFLKARELIARYGTALSALAFADNCLEQHEAGTVSHTYWADVVSALEQQRSGKPHTRHERRVLRGDAR